MPVYVSKCLQELLSAARTALSHNNITDPAAILGPFSLPGAETGAQIIKIGIDQVKPEASSRASFALTLSYIPCEYSVAVPANAVFMPSGLCWILASAFGMHNASQSACIKRHQT